MNKIIAIAFFTLGFVIPVAAEVYKLEPGENISSLLVNRLGHQVIYRNKYLDLILKYNNLNRRSARRLKIGMEIKIPSAVIDAIEDEKTHPITEMLKPVTEIGPSQVAPSIPVEYSQLLRLAGKFESLRGKSVGTSIPYDYSLLLARTVLGFGFERFKDGHELYASIDTSFVKLSDDSLRTGRDSFFLAEGSLLYHKFANEDWSFGGHGKYGQDIYVEIKNSTKYEIQTPWIFGVGPHVKYRNLGLSTLFIPSQKIVSDQRTKGNYKFLLNYKTKHIHNFWDFEGSYANISTKNSNARNVGGKVQYTWLF